MHARTLNKDLAGSLLVIAIGVLVAGVGFTYRTGTLRQMGAGFLPVVFGVLMTLVGLAMAISSRTAAPAEDEPPAEPRTDSPWRGWLCIVGGVVAFVVLGDPRGLLLRVARRAGRPPEHDRQRGRAGGGDRRVQRRRLPLRAAGAVAAVPVGLSEKNQGLRARRRMET
jgi:hypothetical protein